MKNNTVNNEKNKLRKTLQGVVEKIGSPYHFKVSVETKRPHSRYGKIVKSHKSYLVHKNADVELTVGDAVVIAECKPISKRINWELISK
jgi:small subunit ribosomal protein S17